MPDKLYRSLAEFACDMLAGNFDRIYQHDFYTEYYRSAINLLVDPDKKGITDARGNFDFQAVAQSYRIIDKSTESLFVYDFSDASRSLHRSIELQEYLSRDDYRKLQEFSVQVYQYFLIKNRDLFTESPTGLRI
jgi:hypothetical protein